MEEHLRRLIEAISLVSHNYEIYETTNVNNETIVKRAERVYAYELYHKYRSLMERDKVTDCYLNGEIYKDADVFKAIDGHGCYPDLILHRAYDKIDKDSQFFVCEIKMAGNQKLTEDLDKLTKLSKSELNFHYYIFLCVGLNMQTLKDKLKNKITHDYNGNIICICVNNSKPKVCRLSELL